MKFQSRLKYVSIAKTKKEGGKMAKFVQIDDGRWVNMDRVFSIKIEEVGSNPTKYYRIVFYGEVGGFWENEELDIRTVEDSKLFNTKEEAIAFLKKIGVI